jgi:hypothetical protein
MKKIIGMICLSFLAIFAFAIDAGARSYTLLVSPSELSNLAHERYYTWGINWTVPENQHITSVTLTFQNISKPDSQESDLYVHLLDSVSLGGSYYYDSLPDDQFSVRKWVNSNFEHGRLLNSWDDISADSQEITYDFDQKDMNLLFEYSDNKNFGLGFDPDCNFEHGGIKLEIVTQAPEPTTMLLLSSGLLGFAAFRRRIKKRS